MSKKFLWASPLALVLGVFVIAPACAVNWTRPAQNGTWEIPSTAYVCINLPEERFDEAKEAVDMWDKSLHQWKHFVAVKGVQDPCNYIVLETNEAFAPDVNALAWASSIGGTTVTMRKGRYEQDVKGILLHELGHCLGAQHVPGTLMNAKWVYGEFKCPDATTVAQVAAWNNLSLEILSWCY